MPWLQNKLQTLLLVVFSTIGGFTSGEDVKVLYLGGTHSLGLFGQDLDSQLRAVNIDVTSVVDGGAGPYHWLKAYQTFPSSEGHWYKDSVVEKRLDSQRTVPKIETLIEQIQPAHVLIQTEWNLFATLRSPRREKIENIAEVRFLISKMCKVIQDGGAKAYWVLPPHSHDKRYSKDLQKELAEIMIEVIAEFGFEHFDSLAVTRYSGGYPETDGVTLSKQQHQSWAKAVALDVIQTIGAKNLPQTPTKSKAEPPLLSQPESDTTPELNPLGEIAEELTIHN